MNATVLLSLALGVGAPAPKLRKPHAIVGTWLILTATQDGTTRKVEGDHCWTFTADGRRGSHTLKAEPVGWYMYELNEKTRPPSLDVIQETKTARVIERYLFEFDGDTLTLCVNENGRPTAITAEKGSTNMIYTLKRVPKKD